LNLLDENFPQDRRPLLQAWGIHFRQVGNEFATRGVKDPNLLPLLHRRRNTTFITQDKGFFDPALCHPRYCLALIDASPDDAAYFVRRFLRHPRFNTNARRMGLVVRVHREAIHFWRRGHATLQRADWPANR